MKYIIFTMLLTSCVTPRYTYLKPEKKSFKSSSEKIFECTLRLVERDGVDAEKAQKTCDKIYRRRG
tara:strand:- start:117 stop:314 length:198 start_codon:yes stop_codon:yes gene_type:complete